VFHDAFQYFEAAFGVPAAGAVSLGEARAPGARRIGKLRRRIVAEKIVCIFAEPQFEPKIVTALIAGTSVRRGELDPIGVEIKPGPDAYFTMMRRNGRTLQSCLAG
jgi:zinc transport system substrate-binding protein